jgi:hypothetical protein
LDIGGESGVGEFQDRSSDNLEEYSEVDVDDNE